MNKKEYDDYITEQKIRMKKRYLTCSERKELQHMIDNPKTYIKEETKSIVKGKIIVTNINELRKPCESVTKDDNIKEIIKDLKDTLNAQKGFHYGLSANQIGISKKISLCRLPKYNKQTKKIDITDLIIINPKIIEKSRKVIHKGEGCLSFPGLFIDCDRWVFITLQYQDEKLELRTAVLQDFEGFIIQHETDHTNGITIFKRKHGRIK